MYQRIGIDLELLVRLILLQSLDRVSYYYRAKALSKTLAKASGVVSRLNKPGFLADQFSLGRILLASRVLGIVLCLALVLGYSVIF